jgi:hypothetical protein
MEEEIAWLRYLLARRSEALSRVVAEKKARWYLDREISRREKEGE